MEGFKYLCHITNHLCIAPHTSVQLTNFFEGVPEGKKLFEVSVSTTGIQKQRHKKIHFNIPKAKQKNQTVPQKTSVCLTCDCTEPCRNKGYVCTICFTMCMKLMFFSSGNALDNKQQAMVAQPSCLHRLNDTKPCPASHIHIPTLLFPTAFC